MEPLDPATKKQILKNAPQAEPADVDEYERLLAERFTVDPDIAFVAAPQATAEDTEPTLSRIEQIDRRLAELQGKLFPAKK